MTTEPVFDEAAVRAALTVRLAELDEISSGGRDGRAPVELDQTSVGRLSRVDAMQGQAMALAQERRREAERHRIQEALKRLDEGDYGWCAACGEPIAPKRLELDPAVPTCIKCAG